MSNLQDCLRHLLALELGEYEYLVSLGLEAKLSQLSDPNPTLHTHTHTHTHTQICVCNMIVIGSV